MSEAVSFREEFLHYIWQHQYFSKTNLLTSQQEVILVFKPGYYNTNAGPDFSNARLQIGQEEWNGSVEIHIKASDWEKHQHHTDPKYNQVILHVVWENDKPATRADGSSIPAIELKGRISLHLVHTYQTFLESKGKIPCASFLPQVPDIIKTNMQERVRMERLTDKADRVLTLLQNSGNDWEETTYSWLLANFGFKINQAGMSKLASVLPFAILRRHQHQLLALEALLFGQAGFLTDSYSDEYLIKLKNEFSYLRHKYNLPDNLNRSDWNFLRLRPANFPTVRLAQLAALLHHQNFLFSNFLSIDTLNKWDAFFRATPSAYWQTHVLPNQKTNRTIKGLGKSSLYLLLINAVAPLLVAYGKYKNDESYTDKAIHLLEQLPPEDNHVTRLYVGLDFYHQTAADSQALLQLNHHYCVPRKCLQCSIGNFILKTSKQS